MIKLIITVITSAENNIYKSFIYDYWYYFIKYLNINTDIKVFLLFSNKKINLSTVNNLLTSEIKDNIKVYDVNEDGPVGQPGCLQKTILCFKEILKNENFDFILRTNLSTIFLPNRLLLFLNKYNPSEKIILGVVSNICASGCGYILSKQLLIEFLKYSDKVNLKAPDDVSLYSIIRHYCKPYKIIQKQYFKIESFGNLDYKLWDSQIKSLYNEIINNQDIMHIRLKNKKNRKFDIEFQKYFIKNYLL
tara:strand:+ start:3060 stop:3803 length:744 start_codon:yes stop_codon:yes gene_type:complete